MTVFKDKANLYNMYKKNFIKLQMSVTRTYRHICCEKNFFHRSVLCKIEIDLSFFFWMFMSVYEKSTHEIGLQVCNFYKKRLQCKCFPVEFVKPSRTVVVASEKNYILLCNKKLHRA